MLTLTEAAEHIRTRKLSPVELTKECLARIDRLNPTLNAFILVTADLALEQAALAEREIASGKYRGPLHGIPIALKDLLDIKGLPTTAGSEQYRGRIATEDADLVRRLKEAGAVLLGKTNLHEFAFGGSGLISAFGVAKNPWDTERITGGSSSGSAAAVAAGMCVAAIGTDTGGSIRCPAALCGIVGHRPTLDVFGPKGVVPLSPSFDTVGPMTQTVRDAAVLSHSLLASDSARSAGAAAQLFDPSLLNQSVAKLLAGVPGADFFGDLDPEIRSLVQEALLVLGSLCAGLREVKFPAPDRGKVFGAEIYEYHEPMITTSPELYQPHTLARLLSCAGISATDYIRNQRHLAEERRKALRLCQDHDIDVLITPTVHIPAPKISELLPLEPMALRQYETRRLLPSTAPFSALCWPAISVPCGFTPQGLPVGLQIAGPPGSDNTIFQLAHAYQQSTDWHKQKPNLRVESV
jgi:aspartyl-tRNA(Asn)/glutamyl-tRNA(Gln) amidotransferase subunit A